MHLCVNMKIFPFQPPPPLCLDNTHQPRSEPDRAAWTQALSQTTIYQISELLFIYYLIRKC